jgi:CheY-like chemotaxis protein
MDQRVRILIADDQPHNGYLVSKSLREEGYRTAIVDTADSAWEHIREFQPHIVLLNSMSEGFDSFTLLLEIKQKHPEFPVLVYVIRSGDAIDKLKESISGVLDKTRLFETRHHSRSIRSGGSRINPTARFNVSLLAN